MIFFFDKKSGTINILMVCMMSLNIINLGRKKIEIYKIYGFI